MKVRLLQQGSFVFLPDLGDQIDQGVFFILEILVKAASGDSRFQYDLFYRDLFQRYPGEFPVDGLEYAVSFFCIQVIVGG